MFLHKQYPKDSAGRLLVSNVPVVREHATIEDIEALLLTNAKQFETISYTYVVDEAKKLIGVVSIKEIFRADKKTAVKDILHKDICTVHVDTDQEQVALLALQNNIKAIPVIADDGIFLGIVPSDAIMHIIDKEAIENILKAGGITGEVSHAGTYDDVFKLSIFGSVVRRLPWLVVGLFGGLFAAGIVQAFEETLSHYIIVAAFIPLIVYMSAAIAAQMQAFIIRDLVVQKGFSFLPYVLRQSIIVFFVGTILAGILYATSAVIYNDYTISTVLAVALFFASASSLVTGLAVPYLFNKMGLDPANASGPIGTIIQDVVSVFVYLLVATMLLPAL